MIEYEMGGLYNTININNLLFGFDSDFMLKVRNMNPLFSGDPSKPKKVELIKNYSKNYYNNNEMLLSSYNSG